MEPIPVAAWLYLTALPSICSQCVSIEATWGLFVFPFVSNSHFCWRCPKLYRYLSIRFRCLVAHHGKRVGASLLLLLVRSGASAKQCLQLLQLPFQYLPMRLLFNWAFPVRSGTFWGSMSRFIWGIFHQHEENITSGFFFSPFPWIKQWYLILVLLRMNLLFSLFSFFIHPPFLN